jgi:ABC-2 type transport system ATP-binding protein
VKGTVEQLTDDLLHKLIGYKKNSFGFSGLIKTDDLPDDERMEVSPADIESIMIYFEKEHKK